MLHVFHNRATGETIARANQKKSIGVMTDLSPWTDVYEMSDGAIRHIMVDGGIVRDDGTPVKEE